jgi:hypothetical protein
MWNRVRDSRAVRPLTRVVAIAVMLGVTLLWAGDAQTAQESTKKPTARSAPSLGPSPEVMQKSMEMFGPMMGQMMSGMLDGMLTVLAKPETAQRTAAFTKNYHDALIAQGFSKEDALKIVMAHGIPMPGGR